VPLEWSVFALEDRTTIFDFIEADSPHAAVSVDNAIESQVETLNALPELGRPGRIQGTRELVVTSLPYVVAYRVSGNEIRILRILHGAQTWPDSLPE
jgi:addiction module RelE/StbE family toxin